MEPCSPRFYSSGSPDAGVSRNWGQGASFISPSEPAMDKVPAGCGLGSPSLWKVVLSLPKTVILYYSPS